MNQLTAVKTLSSALDNHARGAVAAFDACAKSGRDGCDAQFEKNLEPVKKGRATAIRLRDAIKSFYACTRNSSDPSVCATGVRNSVRDIAASTAPRELASFPKTAMEMANAAPKAPSASKIIQQNDMVSERVLPPQSQTSFDPSSVYAQLPRTNPLAAIPLRDLVGRSMDDSVKNPFRNDIRVPVFPTLKPSAMLGVPAERIAQLEALRKQYAALKTGVGYSGSANVYCTQ